MKSLRAKILLGYGLALLLLAAVLGWAVHNLRHLGTAGQAILSENYRSILAAGNMLEALASQDGALLELLLGRGREAAARFAAGESRFLPWLGRARDNITIEGEAELVASIERLYQEYLQLYPRLAALNARSPAQAGSFYQESLLPASAAVAGAATRLRELNQQTMYRAGAQAERIAARAAVSMLAVGGAALALGLGFSLVLATWISRPVRQLSAAPGRVAEGSYEGELKGRAGDELGRLAAGFNAMVSRLRAYHRMNIDKLVEEKGKNDALIRSIDDGILLIDDRLQVDNMNPAAERVFGLRFAQDRPLHVLELLGDTELSARVMEAVRGGQSPAAGQRDSTVAIGQGEQARWYQYSLTPVLSAEGRRLATVLLLRDVTRLKEIDRLKDEFLMTASHELKTPLTGIAMSIGLLEESLAGKLESRDREMLEVAATEVGRLRSLVGDLLELSRIESGHIALEFERVPAETLLEKACAVFRQQAAERRVGLGWKADVGTG